MVLCGKQRYKCKDCGCNFVEGDGRARVSAEAKALAVLLYGRGKGSYGFIAKLLGVTPVSVMRWLKAFSNSIPQPEIDANLRDTLWGAYCRENTHHWY
jgi:transposase